MARPSTRLRCIVLDVVPHAVSVSVLQVRSVAPNPFTLPILPIDLLLVDSDVGRAVIVGFSSVELHLLVLRLVLANLSALPILGLRCFGASLARA